MGEIVRGALADRLKRHVPVHPAQRPFRQPDRRRHRRRKLLERRRAEEVRDQRDGRLRAPPRRVERNLVDVLDENVGPAVQVLPVVAVREERKGVSRADAEHLDPIDPRARRTARPPAAEQPYLVPLRGEPAEDLVEMNLRAAGLRILEILPVHEQDAHYIRPMRRASASSTPFTNFALFTVPYRSARRTAS